MKGMRVRLTLAEEALGTASANPELHETYIASKADDSGSARNARIKEEIDAIGEEGVVEKGMTVFPTDGHAHPIFWDYQIRGFLKEAIGVLKKLDGTACSKIKAYKKLVDNYIFVTPRQIVIDTHGQPTGECQRPLRAMTMQGERVSIAHSETVPAGSTVEFSIGLLDPGAEQAVREALDYGTLKGLGQWRNSGKGRFYWDLLDNAGNVIGGNRKEGLGSEG